MPVSSSDSVVKLGNGPISLEQWLKCLHGRGALLPMLRHFAVEELLLAQASAAGLSVATEELQKAADRFRLRSGLSSAEETRAWLEREQLSVGNWEAALERDLLIAKLQDHVTEQGIPQRFAACQADYAKACLRQIVVDREDLARELFSQLREEGLDFGELVARHSIHPSRSGGGRLGVVLRKQLPAAVAEAVFATTEGGVAGPLATSEGFCLFLVEGVAPPELDGPTSEFIRGEIFAEWLDQRMSEQPISFPVLEAL